MVPSNALRRLKRQFLLRNIDMQRRYVIVLSVFSGIPSIPFVYEMVGVTCLGMLDNRTMVVKDEVLCCSIGKASFDVVILKRCKCDVLKYPESIVTASPDNRPSHTPSFLQACTLFAFILQYIVYS